VVDLSADRAVVYLPASIVERCCASIAEATSLNLLTVSYAAAFEACYAPSSCAIAVSLQTVTCHCNGVTALSPVL
jgi:hypothetical protein